MNPLEQDPACLLAGLGEVECVALLRTPVGSWGWITICDVRIGWVHRLSGIHCTTRRTTMQELATHDTTTDPAAVQLVTHTPAGWFTINPEPDMNADEVRDHYDPDGEWAHLDDHNMLDSMFDCPGIPDHIHVAHHGPQRTSPVMVHPIDPVAEWFRRRIPTHSIPDRRVAGE